jgi:hypothetical protein
MVWTNLLIHFQDLNEIFFSKYVFSKYLALFSTFCQENFYTLLAEKWIFWSLTNKNVSNNAFFSILSVFGTIHIARIS